MAGPVNGLSGQQSFPAANTQNVGQNVSNPQENDNVVQPRENEVTQNNQPASGVQNAEANPSQQQPAQENLVASGNAENLTGNEPRGSLLDVTV